MRAKATSALILVLLAACSAQQRSTDSTAVPQDAIIISVIGTNDVHGALLGTDSVGGLELLGGYVTNLRQQRAAQGGAVLLIDAGDMWQGTLESNLNEGAAVVAAFNALGYTAAAFGNHEFDFGPVGERATPQSDDDDPQGVMKARAVDAEFPMLAANLIDKKTGKPVDWPNVYPSVLIDAAGVRVGIIGVMTERALLTTIRANTRGVEVAPIAETVQKEADSLRRDGARVIIVSAHAGSRCTEFSDPQDLSSCNEQGEIFRVANALAPGTVDVIIGGHAHEGIAHFVNGIAVASAYTKTRAFDRIDIYVDRRTGQVMSRRIHPPQLICRYLSIKPLQCAKPVRADLPLAPAIYAGKPVMPQPEVSAAIAPAIETAQAIKSSSLGIELATGFNRSNIPEASVGNLVMDALLDSSDGADFAIHNSRGGIRADLPAGELLYGSLYEMFPFDNRMVTIELSGAELKSVMTNQLTSGYWRAGISGGKVIAECGEDQLDVRIVRDSGAEVFDDEQLRIVTADFLTTGGDNIFSHVTPPDGFPIEDDAPLIRDVVESWLRNRGGVIFADSFFDENNRRFVYESPPPIDCR